MYLAKGRAEEEDNGYFLWFILIADFLSRYFSHTDICWCQNLKNSLDFSKNTLQLEEKFQPRLSTECGDPKTAVLEFMTFVGISVQVNIFGTNLLIQLHIHNTYSTILRVFEDIFLLCIQNSVISICQQNDAHYFMDHPVSPCPRFLVARGHNRGRRQPEQQQQQQ